MENAWGETNSEDPLSVPSTSSSPTVPTTNDHRLGMCEVCNCIEARYTCPRCEVKTCCLRCARIHKDELECDGTRDKTKFIPVNKFTNIDLSSDYRLLEEITRNVETLKKSPGRKNTRIHRELPAHLHKLRKAMSDRNTILMFMPRNFKRHKENTTYLNFRSNAVFWHVEWVFVNADNLKLFDDKVPENTKLSNLLHKYLIKQEDKAVQERLRFYQAADLPGIRLLLKAEQKGQNKFYELDPLISIKDNLKNKIIIEYPIVHVVLKEHAVLYDVLDSDGEDDEMEVDVKSSSGKEVVDRIIKKAEKEESLLGSLKNLLFISELSENEISD